MGKKVSKKRSPRKTLIDPKIRLLLLIYLNKGLKDDPVYLSKLARKLQYSEGSIKSHLIPELIRMRLIESSNVDGRNPPFRTTNRAKKVLAPFILVRNIALYFTALILVAAAALPFYALHPWALYYWFIPLITFGFALLIGVLFFYPDILLRSSRSPLPKN
jgi:hypothetical protein